MKVIGYVEHPDYSKLGTSLLIASALILGIGTAKWPAKDSTLLSEPDLDREIVHSVNMAHRILSHLLIGHKDMFPKVREPRYEAGDEDVMK